MFEIMHLRCPALEQSFDYDKHLNKNARHLVLLVPNFTST